MPTFYRCDWCGSRSLAPGPCDAVDPLSHTVDAECAARARAPVHVHRIETCAVCAKTPCDGDEGAYVTTAPATRLDPAEGEWICEDCCRKDDAEDAAAEEARFDRWRDERW